MVDGRRGGTISGGRRISMGAGWSTRRAQDGARDRALDEEQRMVIYDVLFRRACTDLPTPRQAWLGDGWLGEGAAGNQPAHARSRTAHSLASTFFPAATPSSLCSVLLCSLTFLSSHFSPALLPRLRSTPALVHPISQPKRTPPSSLRPAPAASTASVQHQHQHQHQHRHQHRHQQLTLAKPCSQPARTLLAPCSRPARTLPSHQRPSASRQPVADSSRCTGLYRTNSRGALVPNRQSSRRGLAVHSRSSYTPRPRPSPPRRVRAFGVYSQRLAHRPVCSTPPGGVLKLRS
jgi:hypothetical protein